MSKTQKEIAAPKACNKNLTNFVLLLTTVFLTACAAFAGFAQKTELFSTNAVLAAVLFISLIWLSFAAITWAIILKIGRPLLILVAFALLAAAVIFYLLTAKNVVLFTKLTEKTKFTQKMLIMIIASVLAVAAAVLCISRFRKDGASVFATFCGLFLSVPQMFSALQPASDVASNVWGMAGGSILALLCVYLVTVFFWGKQRRGRITTKWITYCAALSALSVVAKIMGNSISIIPYLKFTPTYTVWVIAGIVLGPAGGMLTGAVGDVLGQLILPSGVGALNPFLTLSNALFALFPALLYKYLPKKRRYSEQAYIGIGMFISTCVCTLGISSFVLWEILAPGMGYWEYFVTMRAFQSIIVVLNYVLVIAILPSLKRAKIDNLRFLEKRDLDG